MLIVQAVGGERFHFGGFAIGWLLAVALVVGLGLGPALSHYASVDPPAITQAAGATAPIVAAMGAGGLAFGNDLMAWYRPLTFALLGVILVSLVLVVFGSGGSAFVSLAIGGVWALLLLVDFNYVRHHATGDDVVFLATGIFASVVNIFVSLLNLQLGLIGRCAGRLTPAPAGRRSRPARPAARGGNGYRAWRTRCADAIRRSAG